MMEKILTIFERDWDGNRGVIDKPIDSLDLSDLRNGVATEKLNGTNVRVTVRNHIPVRLEKRRNPSKTQKQQGVVDPWYVDADEYGSEDKYLFEAMKNTEFGTIPDGEWSAEAIGPKIQGNPLMIEDHLLFFFSLPHWRSTIRFSDCPITYDTLRDWLPKQHSWFNATAPIEGIVWHLDDGRMFKIKIKDFKDHGHDD